MDNGPVTALKEGVHCIEPKVDEYFVVVEAPLASCCIVVKKGGP